MKLNAEKCEFIVTGHCFKHLWLNVGETQVWGKNQVKLLGITTDNELKFDDHYQDMSQSKQQTKRFISAC